MHRLPVLLSLSLLLAPLSFATVLAAQLPPKGVANGAPRGVANGVATGQRVRVASPGANGEFTVRSVTRDTIVVAGTDSAAIYAVPVGSISRLQIGEPRSRAGGLGRGMGYGFLIGGGIGGVVGFADGDDECAADGWCIIQFSAGEKAVMAGTVFGVAGAVIGGLIGASSPGYRWHLVALEGVAFAPAPDGGFTASASLRF